MNRLVCGMVVDEDLYDKYNWSKETGMRRKYTLGGQEMSLDIVEFYSTAESCKVFYPELAENAKRVAEQIRKEIRDYYAAKDGRKEYVTMKHDTFSEYIKDLQEIHAKSAPERRELKEKMDMAQKRWEENQREFKSDEHFLAREKVVYLDAQEAYKNNIRELQKRTKEEIQAVQAEYDRHLNDFYVANGNRIDESVVKLLKSGIRLTDAEIDNMVSQNKSNPTMLRLISDHCDANEISSQSARIYGALARKNGTEEREAFRTIAGMVEKAVSEDETTSKVWGTEHSHFERLSNQQIESMNAYSIQPAVNQEAASI